MPLMNPAHPQTPTAPVTPTASRYPPMLPPDFAEFAPRLGYQVEPDGRVYTVINGEKSYQPPWIVWQNSHEGRTPDGLSLTEEGRAYRTPGSDPNSAWRFMFENGGPFTHHSQWDDKNGTYQGSIDWPTLIGTVAAGALIGGGALAAGGVIGGGGGGAAGSAGVGLGETGATVGGVSGATLPGAVTIPATLGTEAAVTGGTVAGGAAAVEGGGVGLGETGATVGGLSGSSVPGATVAPTVGDLAVSSSAIPGATGTSTAATTGSSLSRYADLANKGGSMLSAASRSQGETQRENNNLGVQVNNSNIRGQEAYENSLEGRSKLEQQERQKALVDVYMASRAQHAPRSPFNPTGPPTYSQEYMDTLMNLSSQGSGQLRTPAKYGTGAMTELKPYDPYKPDTDPSTLSKVNNWVGPALGLASAYFGSR